MMAIEEDKRNCGCEKEVNKELMEELEEAGIRVELDERNEKIGYKIREAQVQKIPYMLVIGDKEKEAGEITVRSRSKGDLGNMSLDEFLEKIQNQIQNKQ